jgi:tRNA threonylcarbamoyl adenosine modification protein YjeE
MHKTSQFDRLMSEGLPVSLEIELSSLDSVIAGFLSCVHEGCWIFLNGDLGTGKTTFTRMLLKQMGFAMSVSSPTFSILNVIDLPQICSGVSRVCHLDLYRIKNSAELCHLGLELEFRRGALCVFEWAENIEPDGWNRFFQVTGCRTPSAVISVDIHRAQRDSVRTYTFSRLNSADVLGLSN